MKRVVVLAMMVSVLFGAGVVTDLIKGNVVVAEAATIKTKSYDLAIAETLNLSKKLSGVSKTANYSYSTNKKAVATVSKKGVVTAVNAGTAKVTIKETKNGKTSTIGTVKITVHKAEVSIFDEYFFTTAEGALEKNPYQLKLEDFVSYINPKAEYTWYSGNTKALKITKGGKITHTEGKGRTWVDITIKEKYKGKTRKVGTSSVLVVEPTLEKESGTVVKLNIGDEYHYVWDMSESAALEWYVLLDDELYTTEQEVQNARLECDADNSDEDGEIDPVADFAEDSDGYPIIKANGAGTKYLYYFSYDFVTEVCDDYLGYVKIVISE